MIRSDIPQTGRPIGPAIQILHVSCRRVAWAALAWFCVFHAGLPAEAAAPANDLCAGAEIIPGAGPFPYATMILDITDATINANDPPVSNPDLAGHLGRSVWYRFTPRAASVYTITSCSDAGAATTVADTTLAVYRSSGGCSGPFTQVGMLGDEDCGPNGAQAAVTVALAADTTYYIVVWKYCDNCAQDDGVNQLQLLINGNVAPPNDACAAAARVELNLPVAGTTVGATDNYELSGTNGFRGLDQTPSPARGRDVVYSFTAPDTGLFSIKVLNYDVNQDVVLYVLTNCPAGAGPIVSSNSMAAANRSRVNSAEEIVCLPLAAGARIYIVVDDHNLDNPGSTFVLEVTRCFGEVEPNDDPAHASPLFCGTEASITPQFDVDFFVLGHYPAGWRAFALVDGEASKNQDFDLRITTATNTVEYDNNDNDAMFGDSSPNVAGTPLPAEPAFVAVSYNGSLKESEPYRLYAVVQPPLEQAAIEIEPNDDVSVANLDDRNYFFGTLAGPGPSADVDVYAFSVDEGDLLFLSLDGDPHRTNTPVNARLELLDADGNTLVAVNDDDSTSTTNGLAGLFPTSPAEGLVYRSAVEGLFFARVSISPRAGGNASFGDYLLSITKNCVIGPLGQNHAPILTNIALGPPVTVGLPATLTGGILELDTGDTLSVEIQWGDGTTNRMENTGAGWIDLALPHTYTTVNVTQTVTITAVDGNGNRTSLSRAVLVRPPPEAARVLSLTPSAGGPVVLAIDGTPNGFYRIDKAEIFGVWIPLGTVSIPVSGQVTFEDPNPSPTSSFYRIVGLQ